MKHVVAIKPLSVNRAWQGKRYKTESYKTFEQNMNFLLPKKIEIPAGNLKVTYEFGLSNMLADVDNQLKPLQDILQHKYGFNDSRIHEIIARKRKVKKGFEYVSFHVESIEDCLEIVK